MKINIPLSNDRFSELINRTLMGERIIIEQEGKAAAAIITYIDLQRFEAIEALLKKAELEEHEWLKAVIRNPAFDSLKNSEEEIYTLKDGKPFDDIEWTKTVINNPSFSHYLRAGTNLLIGVLLHQFVNSSLLLKIIDENLSNL